jgi:hypothetical protein
LQALVSAEDAAVFGVSALGGRLANLAPTDPGVAILRTLYDTHRLRRDSWALALRTRHGQVPDAAAAYAVATTSTATQVLAAAADLESRCSAAYGVALEALVDTRLRAAVMPALIDAARRTYALGVLAGRTPGAASTALPGG